MESVVVRLNSATSSAIRKGQIITKLSDVVRELIDNAVDAGSSRIQIVLDNYGLDKIEVRDDGHGISANQLRSAVSGGYTSKLLQESNHLSCEENYGFRGEALSSICFFANVTIVTKTPTDSYAMKYEFDDSGGVKNECRSGSGLGTQVTVKDLFAKYPVRRKFIRERSRVIAELKEIEGYLKSIAIANPSVYLSLVHNGNSIWSKPLLASTEQALVAVLGIQVAKQLSKCGPINIVTLGYPDVVSKLELYLPKQPIDTKLLNFTSNKMCYVIVNRRRVQIKDFEKMLQQYIMGAIQLGNQNSKAKYPLAVLKLDVPSAFADFNLDVDKSKVFLIQKNEILVELEAMLKSFYPVDFNTIKENLESRQSLGAVVDDSMTEGKQTLQTLTKSRMLDATTTLSTQLLPEVKRNENILAFLDDFPTLSTENFSRSPGKTPSFQKRKVIAKPSTSTSSLQKQDNSGIESDEPSTSPTTLRPEMTLRPDGLAADRAWAFGQMKGTHGSVIENTTIVRRTAFVPGEPLTGQLEPRICESDIVVNFLTNLEFVQNTPGVAQEFQDEDEFFSKIRTCHLRGAGTPLSLDPPPSKRRRSESLFSQKQELPLRFNRDKPSIIKESSLDTLLYQSSSIAGQSTPKKPYRQVTLDNLLNWKSPRVELSQSSQNSSLTPTPINSDNLVNFSRGGDDVGWIGYTPSAINKVQIPSSLLSLMTVPEHDLQNESPALAHGSLATNFPITNSVMSQKNSSMSRVGDHGKWVGYTPSETKTHQPLTTSLFPLMPVSVRGVKNVQPKELSSISDTSIPTKFSNNSVMNQKRNSIFVAEDDLRVVNPSVPASAFFKQKTVVTPIQLLESHDQKPSHRVIGEISGTSYYVVKIDSLIGVFCPKNLLRSAPWLQEKCVIPGREMPLDLNSVEILLREFTCLSTDVFTKEMVSRFFMLLSGPMDLAE